MEAQLKIKTEFVNPPIPFRGCDWAAWIEGNEEDGPYGRGETRSEALGALLEASDALYESLYERYLNSGEMPIGVAKARTGDPYEWIYQKFTQSFNEPSTVLKLQPANGRTLRTN